MQNFSINLPSIPTSRIKFKIQSSKQKGFNHKQLRFKDNFSYLTDHFINSFPNLQLPQSPKRQQPNKMSEISTNHSFSFGNRSKQQFRMMVSDNKKNLLVQYKEKYQHYSPNLHENMKKNKGFSFGRSGLEDNIEPIKVYPSQQLQKSDKIIDNYYFNTEESEEESQDQEKIMLEKRRQIKLAKKKVVKKSAVFENEDRWKSLQRDMKNKNNLGPGQYVLESVSKKKKKRENKQKLNKSNLILPKLQSVIEMIKDIHNPEQLQEEVTSKEGTEKKQVLQSSMFKQGNVDRFGQMKYPINPKVKVPGPGAYYHQDTLQSKANKILILQQQRKLLKQWYNR